MEFTHVELTQHDTVAVISLNHPPANALSRETFSGISDALDVIEKDESMKVVVVKGNGRFFAAGADIKEFTSIEQKEVAEELAKNGQRVFDRMEAFSKPIIAAIHGAALGGGLELALACHMRFATPDAKLGLPELNLGLIPGFAGTQRLPQLIGKAKALELLLTSAPMTGSEAVNYGLVNRVIEAEKLESATLEFAHSIATKGAISMKFALQAILEGEQNGLQAGQTKEAELFGRIFETEDAKEGIRAFMEKRKPSFKDK